MTENIDEFDENMSSLSSKSMKGFIERNEEFDEAE